MHLMKSKQNKYKTSLNRKSVQHMLPTAYFGAFLCYIGISYWSDFLFTYEQLVCGYYANSYQAGGS